MRSVILYTTRYGCVEKVVNILKEALGGEVTTVNLKLEQPPNLAPYDCVILGGSIYYGRTQKELTQFAYSALPELIHKRVGLFICAGHPDEGLREQELKNAYPEQLYHLAAVKDVLGDEITYCKLSRFEKFILRLVHKVKEGHSHIPMNKIQQFARQLTLN